MSRGDGFLGRAPDLGVSLVVQLFNPTNMVEVVMGDQDGREREPLAFEHLEYRTGVAGIDVIGGYVKKYAVRPDPARMTAYGVGLNEVVEAVEHANTVAGAVSGAPVLLPVLLPDAASILACWVCSI